MYSYNKHILWISCIFLFFTWKKDENTIPKTGDNFYLYNIQADPEYTNLLAPFGKIVVTGGYKKNGIFVYRIKTEEAIDDFVAYDRTCPYEANECKMESTKGNSYTCTCKCCGSIFNIYGGYLEKGPSKFPLRKYNCEYIDGNIHIY